jgi:hypothetical protein
MINGEIKGLTEIVMTCTRCKKERPVRTNKPEMYTQEIKDKYICVSCK